VDCSPAVRLVDVVEKFSHQLAALPANILFIYIFLNVRTSHGPDIER
jgi:hypothetical protein